MSMIDDDDNLDEIPLGIMRLAQDVSRKWRRCHRKACKRARACRGHGVPCADERSPRKPPRDPEKARRGETRAIAFLQRKLKEKLAEHEHNQRQAAVQQAPRRRAD